MTRESSSGTPTPEGTDAFAPTTQLADLADAEANWNWLTTADDATARNALASPELRDGIYCLQMDTQVLYRRISGAWEPWDSGWISYTPTLTGFAVGTGGAAAAGTWYKYVGGRVRVKFVFVFGSSGATFPTGATVTLPSGLSMRAPYWANEVFAACQMLDSGTASTWAGLVVYNGTDVDKFRINYKNGFLTSASLTTTAPWTWVAGDGFAGEFEYDPA